jgi:ABC-2 type transport system ATP-binding protein
MGVHRRPSSLPGRASGRGSSLLAPIAVRPTRERALTDATSPGTAARPAGTGGRPGLAIEAEGLRKSYGKVEALCGVDLAVPEGSVLGLLGPNGAGKTTAVRILATLLPPDGGTARVAGFDVVREAAALRAHIGLAGQYAAVDENLSGHENLEMVGRLYHMPRADARRRADVLLERFDLNDAARRLVRTYSGGMRRRLDLAAALVVRPPVLFLDEPTTGLDPRSRIQLWEAVEARVEQGTTVLLTTQYLDEADRLADRIAVIDRGAVIAEGTSDELKARVGGDQLEVVLEDPSQADAAVGALAPMAAEPPSVQDGTVVAVLRRRKGAVAEAVRRLDAAGAGVDDLSLRRPTLDDVFLVLTGRSAEEAEDGEGDGEREEER